MNYVIIGNSAAAVGCVEGIRQVDQKGKITIISDEPYHTYSRPLISYLLCGKTTEELMRYRPDDFYQTNKVETILGQKVTKIDPDAKQVLLESGKTVSYDKLLCATGSSPFVPPMKGLETVEQKFTFMTLDAATALQKAITPESNVLIIGAGLIGLKCAEGIFDSVRSVTVVDLAPHILSSILDEAGAQMMQRHLEKQGLKFYLNDSVESFDHNTALLKSGEKLMFDQLVLAVGVRPNVSLIKDAGGKVGRGIVIDATMQTSLPDVYAAGDCTESHDISSDQDRILALLPNAYLQGECAGKNMAGASCVFDKAIPMNAIGLLGLHIITAGSYEGEEKCVQDKESYKKMFIKDGKLKGYILIGNIDRAGIYTNLIREQTPLSEIDFDMVFEHPSLMAFGRGYRDKVLAGK